MIIDIHHCEGRFHLQINSEHFIFMRQSEAERFILFKKAEVGAVIKCPDRLSRKCCASKI